LKENDIRSNDIHQGTESKYHIIVLVIDVNVAFDSRKRDSDTYIRLPTYWPNNIKQRLHRGAKKCQRGSKRIGFIFYTLRLSKFVTTRGITTYNMIAPSNWRELFIDIDIQNYLENSFDEVTHHTSKTLQTRETAGLVTYKKQLIEFTK